MENLVKELLKVLNNLESAQKELETLKKEQKQIALELAKLRQERSESTALPEWIPSSKAMEILCIKKADTLRAYAKMGLLEVKRAYDKRNYYRTAEVMALPEKLFELQNEQV